MLFSQIPGHPETKKLLVKSVQNGHVAHAQLFLGGEGSANLALALAYATYLNCENPSEADSCGTCAACSKMNKLVHPDMNFVMPVTSAKSKEALSQNFLTEWREFLLENPFQTLNDWMQFIGAENKQGNISKDESRQLIRFASLKAFEAEFKVILIWLPELLHPTAANALLKLLEEPPAKTIFLLVPNSSEKILPTILSRTQKVNVRAFSDEEVVAYLQENLQVSETAAHQVATLAEGNLQAAMKLSQELTPDYFNFFVQWMRNCYSYKFGEVVEMSDDFQKLGRENQKAFLHYALNNLRRVMLYGVDAQLVPFVPPAELDFVSKFSKVIRPGNVSKLSEELSNAHYHIERNANPKIVFVDSSIQIAKYLKSGN